MRRKRVPTPEEVMETGKMMAKQRLKNISRQDLLEIITPEELLAGLTLEERLAGLTPEELLAGLTPEERLAGLSIQEIEQYLAVLKKQTSSTSHSV